MLAGNTQWRAEAARQGQESFWTHEQPCVGASGPEQKPLRSVYKNRKQTHKCESWGCDHGDLSGKGEGYGVYWILELK